LGHAAGDELLQVLARRMLACIRESDTLARVGGDEFIAVLRGDIASGEISRVIERLTAGVAHPVVLKHGEVTVSCSIGCAAYPEDGLTIEALMVRSDVLMYEQKRRERSIRIEKADG
ncbi:MAG: GGDEF domain-containing protein, partial [Rhodocyclaceae bacterium]|nr:GGDEF domain-containing protein [Rhodocyclaceae bacterium]